MLVSKVHYILVIDLNEGVPDSSIADTQKDETITYSYGRKAGYASNHTQ